MSLVGLKKNQIKSAILCEDRDFKRKSITYLNNAAYSGEKFHLESVSDTLDLIVRDSMVRNIVADSKFFSDEALEPALQQIHTVIKNLPVRMLCYLQDHQHALEDKLKESMPGIQFAFSPMSQAAFNRCFSLKNQTEKETVDAGTKVSTDKKPALSVLEASAHLKETIELLNQFSTDKNKKAALLAVGQRFNGLVGGFAFLQDQPGYKSLCQLAKIIDEICRHYEIKDQQVREEHWLVIKESAKCAYLLLRDLREQASAESIQKWVNREEELSRDFTAFTDIHLREQLDQDSVDALLDEIQSKIS